MIVNNNLKSIKDIVDSYFNGSYDITVGNDDFDITNHVYDVNVIMGIIRNHVYEGLRLPINSQERRTRV